MIPASAICRCRISCPRPERTSACSSRCSEAAPVRQIARRSIADGARGARRSSPPSRSPIAARSAGRSHPPPREGRRAPGAQAACRAGGRTAAGRAASRLAISRRSEARALTHPCPFATGPNPAARPVPPRRHGCRSQRARSIASPRPDLYEAGDDADGEQAVAQVVINRLRHPAFPKTVCGVVFQGSDRRPAASSPSPATARSIAGRRPTPPGAAPATSRATALSGAVDKPVGYATHYHTDWVVPYWSASLDKIARGRHRICSSAGRGWWGTPPAFNRHAGHAEPVIAPLAPISPAHATADRRCRKRPGRTAMLPIDATALPMAACQALCRRRQTAFFVTLDPKWPADSLPALAAASAAIVPIASSWPGQTRRSRRPASPITPAQVAGDGVQLSARSAERL